MNKTIVIDCFATGGKVYGGEYAVVAIDVIRATTTAITAVDLGRRCYPVVSVASALSQARRLDRALLAGELGGVMPAGFHLNNSPAALAERSDIMRPLILLSSSGTKLLWSSREASDVYLACFRNATSVARHIAGKHESIAILGAGSRGEFREEDQLCAAWIAADLMKAGYSPADTMTTEIVERWSGAPATACLRGKSAAYLRRSGQQKDLDFVLSHVNDLEDLFIFDDGEVIRSDGRTALAVVA